MLSLLPDQIQDEYQNGPNEKEYLREKQLIVHFKSSELRVKSSELRFDMLYPVTM
jgi:hypothetical protein